MEAPFGEKPMTDLRDQHGSVAGTPVTGRHRSVVSSQPLRQGGPQPSDSVVRSVPVGRRRRPTTPWDIAAFLLLLAFMLAATGIGLSAANVKLGNRPALWWSAAIVGGLAVVLLIATSVRLRSGPRAVSRGLAAAFVDPPGSWAAFALGAILATPMLALYSPVLFYDADSARIVAAVGHVQQFGLGFIVDTQDNLLPHLILGPALALGGIPAAKLVAIGTLILLSGLVGWLTFRITASMSAVIVAALVFAGLSPVIERGALLPMYPTMLALGYLGAWLGYRTLISAAPRPRLWIGAGLCLALAPEAQPVGVLFLVAPLLLLCFTPSRRAAARMLILVYGSILLFSIPRLVINLWHGGLTHIASYRDDFWTSGPYLRSIQVDFWGYHGSGEQTGEFLLRLPGRFVGLLGTWGWIALAIAGLAVILVLPPRSRWFVLAVVVFYASAVTFKRINPAARYYSPLFPGIAILCGVAIATLMRSRFRVASRAAVGLVIIGLAVLQVITMSAMVTRFNTLRYQVQKSPLPAIVGLINDGKGVIGARSTTLDFVSSDVQTWGGQFLTEEEYVTYLSWPSDQQVLDMFAEHDIGWVLINPKRQLETAYHDTWLVPYHGVRARQIEGVKHSPQFCRRYARAGWVLFQVGSCDSVPGPVA